MVKAFPLNQQEYSYNAQDVSYYYAGRHSGVFALDTNCQVSIVSNMTIKVAKGKGWLAHGVDYGVVFWMEEDVLLTVPVGDVASPRWDYVCIGWETTEVKENPTIYIKSGSPAVTPAEPTLENSANKIEICLAKIYIPSGTTNLRATGVSLTDTRADKNYCGLVGDDLRTTKLEERATNLENRTTNLEKRESDSETEINNIKKGTTSAGKAEKMTNARTINGTPFDGSSNIITQKWGAIRKIYTPAGVVNFDGGTDLSLDFIKFERIVASGSSVTINAVDKARIKCVLVRVDSKMDSFSLYVKRKNNRQMVLYSNGYMYGSSVPECKIRKVDVLTDSITIENIVSSKIVYTPCFFYAIIIDVPFTDI